MDWYSLNQMKNSLLVGRRWPVILGAGFGIGSAYTNCERDLNSTLYDSTSKQNKVQ
jgi:inner membrane organizing system protein 1